MSRLKKFLKTFRALTRLLPVALLSLLALAVPAKTNAALFSIDGVLTSALGWVVFGINYIIATIFGIGISIISYFISVVLQLNFNLVNTPIVQNGFTITLSVANLGFVLAIIIIAIMTIIRYETYALKNTLWKLIAAAILVNFSLVICSSILNFSDRLTSSFLNAFTSSCQTGAGTAGATQAATQYNKYDCFATAIAGSFSPQRVFLTGLNGVDPSKLQDSTKNFSGVLIIILNLFFPTLFLIVATIAMGGLFIMLLMRYVYIAILMILMPMAWLLWIFPATSGQWKAWWSKFIEWTMFAPIVVFFIYLSVLTMAAGAAQPTSSIDTAATSGVLANNMIGSLLQMATMVALLLAGLFFAKSMGIEFAGATLNGATAVTSGFGAWAGKRGRMVAGRAMQPTKGFGFSQISRNMQSVGTGTGVGSTLLKYSGLGLATRLGGRALENLTVTNTEALVKEYGEDVKHLTKDQAKHQITSSNTPRTMAILERAQKEGWLGEIPNLERYVGDGTEDKFERYGQSKLRNGIRGESGIELRKLASTWASAEGGKKQEAMDEIIKHFRSAPNAGILAETFFQDFEKLKADHKPIPFNMSDEEIKRNQEAIVRGVAKGFAPGNLSEFFKKLAKGSQLESFETATKNVSDIEVSAANLKWLDSSTAKGMGIGPEIFGQKNEPKINMEKEKAAWSAGS